MILRDGLKKVGGAYFDQTKLLNVVTHASWFELFPEAVRCMLYKVVTMREKGFCIPLSVSYSGHAGIMVSVCLIQVMCTYAVPSMQQVM